MIRTAKQTAEKFGMLQKGDSLLCGFSGGADSVALLLFLLKMKEEYDLALYAVHVNHMIRGAEAKRDEKFCKVFCREKGVPLFVTYADIPRICQKNGESAELAARKARYDCFEELCREHSIQKVALAHNADDNAETILINMIRGSGISGLCGIPPVRDNIIRPFIETTRDQIEQFLKEQNQEFVTDSTNLSDDYTRNKLRHGVLPRFKEINPSVLQVLTRQGGSLRDDRDFLEAEAKKLAKRACRNEKGIDMDVSDIIKAPRALSLRALSCLCRELGGPTPSKKNVEDLLALCQKNKTSLTISFGGLTARTAYGRLSIFPKEENSSPLSYCYTLTGTYGEIKIGETPFHVRYRILQNHGDPAETEKKFIKFDQKIQKNLKYALIDYDKIVDSVIIRTRKTKDKYVPLGFSGHRTIKKMMIDEKIPQPLRNILPVFESKGEILWVWGLRENAAFAAGCKTENLLLLEVYQD